MHSLISRFSRMARGRGGVDEAARTSRGSRRAPRGRRHDGRILWLERSGRDRHRTATGILRPPDAASTPPLQSRSTDGKIVAGNTSNEGGRPTAASWSRYDVNGTLDPSFADGGIDHQQGRGGRYGHRQNVRILVIGTSRVGNSPPSRPIALFADGTLDVSFGAGGVTRLRLGGEDPPTLSFGSIAFRNRAARSRRIGLLLRAAALPRAL